jgi:hypothetical protein
MTPSSIRDEWKNQTAVLATMHEKERVIAPLLYDELGVRVLVPENFDTDRFGTFTREVARAGNQLQAARKKAYAAMEQTGLTLGLASEGSFGTHPAMPFIPSCLEIVVLIDKKNNLEIVGHFRTSEVQVKGQSVTSVEEAIAVATSWGFPEQGIIVRASEKSNRNIYKNITTLDELQAISKKLLSSWRATSLFLETDMRAHRCPARMESIKQATVDLIENCRKLCPQCSAPGFVVTDTVKGLPCSGCHLATDLVKETISSCQKCNYTEAKPIPDKTFAEPKECQWCNP